MRNDKLARSLYLFIFAMRKKNVLTRFTEIFPARGTCSCRFHWNIAIDLRNIRSTHKCNMLHPQGVFGSILL